MATTRQACKSESSGRPTKRTVLTAAEVEALIVEELISQYRMVLHVKRDHAELIPRKSNGRFADGVTGDERFPVSMLVVEDLAISRRMAPLTKNRIAYKDGWREMGLPSPAPGEYWLFVQ